MKMTKIILVPCLLPLISAATSAQIVRVVVPVSPLSVVAGLAPRLQVFPSAPGASLPAVPILSLATPALPLLSAAPVSAPADSVKTALAGLETGSARFAQAERDGASAEAGRGISSAMFDAADKKSASGTPSVDVAARPSALPPLVFALRVPESSRPLLREVLSMERNEASVIRWVKAALGDYNRTAGRKATLADLKLYAHYHYEADTDHVYQLVVEIGRRNIGVIVAYIDKATHKMTLGPNDD